MHGTTFSLAVLPLCMWPPAKFVLAWHMIFARHVIAQYYLNQQQA